MIKIYCFCFIGGLLLLAACSSSRVTSVWKAPGATAQPYKKIMVAGIIREADRTLRIEMENHLTSDLKNLGYAAFSAFEEYGPHKLTKMKEEEVYEKLRKEGVDAVLTIVLLDKQKEKYYVPERVIHSPYGYYQGRFPGYYNSLYDRIESFAYYQESTHYFWESNLYDLNTKELVFSVQTQSFDPASTSSLAHQYGQMIVVSMVKHGVLGRQDTAGRNLKLTLIKKAEDRANQD